MELNMRSSSTNLENLENITQSFLTSSARLRLPATHPVWLARLVKINAALEGVLNNSVFKEIENVGFK
jgi:hypothetical protein